MRLEIYRPEATVILSGGSPARIGRFAAALFEGPTVLTELARFGLVFDESCVDNPNYCVAEPR